tara:strand:- start:43 stop:228 length:186 start_codon:yes stop_codon:yes gene_type:complete
MQTFNNNELATLRISLMDKIDKMDKIVENCQKTNDQLSVLYWQEAIARNTELLNKLYSMQA